MNEEIIRTSHFGNAFMSVIELGNIKQVSFNSTDKKQSQIRACKLWLNKYWKKKHGK